MPNLGIYCLVGVDSVLMGPMRLPLNWENHSGMRMMGNFDLKQLGWLPVDIVDPPYNTETHKRGEPNVDIQTDRVVFNQNLIAYTAEELKQNKWNDFLNKMDKLNEPKNGLPRWGEDIMDAIADINATAFDDAKFNKIKARRANMRTQRANKPPQP